MTRKQRLEQLQAITDKWLPRMGLAHWSVTVTDRSALVHEDAILEILRHDDAHRAVIKPADWFLDEEWTPENCSEDLSDAYIEQSVVHELAHLLFRDVRNLVQDVLQDELAGATKSTLDIALDRHEEATVDLLARGLVGSWPR